MLPSLSNALAKAAAAKAAAEAWRRLAETTAPYHHNLVFGHSQREVGSEAHRVNDHAGHWRDRIPQVDGDVERVSALLAACPPTDGRRIVYPGEGPRRRTPIIDHTPATRGASGRPVSLTARIAGSLADGAVLVHYRPMDQTKPWETLPMKKSSAGLYAAELPGTLLSGPHDAQYYLEVRSADGGVLCPDWRQRTPYWIIRKEP